MADVIRVYIDTSVWNFALEKDRLEYKLTCNFLEQLKSFKLYEIFISNVVMTEINNAYDIRRKELIKLIEKFDPQILYSDHEAVNLAKIYLKEKLISETYSNDALHIATATVNRCNFIVSWNYKHIVKAKIIHSVHLINHKEGYGLVEIVSPREFQV